MIGHPQRSPLFPYTTLFRSARPLRGSRLQWVGRQLPSRPRNFQRDDYDDGAESLDPLVHQRPNPWRQFLSRPSLRLAISHRRVLHPICPGTSNAMIMTMGPNLWTLSYTSALTPGVNFFPAPPFASLSATEAFFTKNITIKEAALQATDILDVQDSSSNPVFQVSAGSDVKMLGAASGGAPSLYIWAGAGSQEWQIQASTASPVPCPSPTRSAMER